MRERLQTGWQRVRQAWMVLRGRATVARVTPTSSAHAGDALGQFRVTRERPLGTIVETLHQGGGARAVQQYTLHNALQDGEWICFYRGNARCSGKAYGD